MLERLRPDRQQPRHPVWFAADALVTVMFVWITVESLRSTAYVDEYGPIEGFGWVLAVSPTVLLLFRRLAPATSLAAATVLYLLASGWQGDSNAPLAIPFFAYSVGLTRPVPVSGWMVGLAAAAMSITVFYGPGEPVVLAIPVTIMLFGIGWLVAVSIRHNQARASELAGQAETARIEAAGLAEQAVRGERARIARELHDAVGHAVNVIVLQAGAARMSTGDERMINSLREIEEVGRSALTDLDHMLGLLRTDDNEVPLEPTRSSADIVRLIEETWAAGADVHFHNNCKLLHDTMERREGAAAYRIVQEALTNAVKHAGRARIDVSLSCDADHLEVVVVDDGLGAATVGTPAGGRGIVGMHERATVLGGTLRAEPGPDGGFRVEARIPRSRRQERDHTRIGR